MNEVFLITKATTNNHQFNSVIMGQSGSYSKLIVIIL